LIGGKVRVNVAIVVIHRRLVWLHRTLTDTTATGDIGTIGTGVAVLFFTTGGTCGGTLVYLVSHAIYRRFVGFARATIFESFGTLRIHRRRVTITTCQRQRGNKPETQHRQGKKPSSVSNNRQLHRSILPQTCKTKGRFTSTNANDRKGGSGKIVWKVRLAHRNNQTGGRARISRKEQRVVSGSADEVRRVTW
jgi:hypothetical protein